MYRGNGVIQQESCTPGNHLNVLDESLIDSGHRDGEKRYFTPAKFYIKVSS